LNVSVKKSEKGFAFLIAFLRSSTFDDVGTETGGTLAGKSTSGSWIAAFVAMHLVRNAPIDSRVVGCASGRESGRDI